jgi:ribosomal RNA-processing protein 8
MQTTRSVANLSRLPLPAASCDAAVFSLALMGTDYPAFLAEAHRVLRPRGTLLIAEVRSRIPSVDAFAELLAEIGFETRDADEGNRMFVVIRAARAKPRRGGVPQRPEECLLPCIYKRR